MLLNFTLDQGAYKPTKAHNLDAGFDLYLKKDIYISKSRDCELVDTGVHVEIPAGYVGLCLPRSSISKKGILIHTGVIDAGYTGSIKISVQSLRAEETCMRFCAGERIAQLVILSLPNFELNEVKQLDTSERGDHGFGSSGK